MGKPNEYVSYYEYDDSWKFELDEFINAIKELLGHANLSATQIYTHNTIEKLQSVYKQAHPRA